MSVKERRQEEGRHAPSRVKHGLADNASSSKSNFAKGKEAEASSSDDDEDDILARTSLDLSNHPMPPLEALAKTIAKFSRLQKLDLSSMKSSSSNPKGLSSLQWLGRATRKGKEKATDEEIFGNSLTWLKMTDNPALGEQTGDDAWAGIENLASLAVLNASSCALTTAPPASALLKLSSLAALVLAHNSITNFAFIPHLPHLNTLVLSHNKIARLPKDLAANLPSLKKLSITQNALQWLKNESPLPDFTQCSHLREVRLSGNSRLGKLPSHLSTWGRGEGRDRKGTGLETLELADCGLADWESIGPLINMKTSEDPSRKRRGLGNLSLKGNAITKLSQYQQSILEAHPTLRTLDGDRVEKKVDGDEHEGIDEMIAPVNSNALPNKKRGDKREREPLKDARNGKKGTDADMTAEAASEDLKSASKARVRGKRGGRPGKANADGNGFKEEATTAREVKSRAKVLEAKSRGKVKKNMKSKDASADEKISRRAGPPPSSDVSKKKVSKSDERSEVPKAGGAIQQSKKRKAWDEGAEEKKVYGKKKVAQSSPPPQKAKEKERAQTSVAAVIQLNKKHEEASKVDKPVWGQIGGAEDHLGGSAWD